MSRNRKKREEERNTRDTPKQINSWCFQESKTDCDPLALQYKLFKKKITLPETWLSKLVTNFRMCSVLKVELVCCFFLKSFFRYCMQDSSLFWVSYPQKCPFLVLPTLENFITFLFLNRLQVESKIKISHASTIFGRLPI